MEIINKKLKGKLTGKQVVQFTDNLYLLALHSQNANTYAEYVIQERINANPVFSAELRIAADSVLAATKKMQRIISECGVDIESLDELCSDLDQQLHEQIKATRNGAKG